MSRPNSTASSQQFDFLRIAGNGKVFKTKGGREVMVFSVRPLNLGECIFGKVMGGGMMKWNEHGIDARGSSDYDLVPPEEGVAIANAN